MSSFDPSQLAYILGEVTLGVTILALVTFELIVKAPAKRKWVLPGIALAGLVLAGGFTLGLGDTNLSAFAGQVAIDPMGSLFKLVFVFITGVAVFTSILSKELSDRHIGEYLALLIAILFGMFLMASANDLLMVFLGIEMVSILSYAMAGYRMRDRRSSEAALKYVVYGGASSGLMLFGMSLFYGMVGTTDLSALNGALTQWATGFFTESITATEQAFPLTLLLAMVFFFAGVGYKIAVVPFHMWSPDVYEGAPTPFTGFLSVGPKAAGFAVLIRVFINAFVPAGADGSGFATEGGLMSLSVDLPLPAMIGIVAAVTMTLGNLAAIPQNNVKRLLAYSSIAHAGYILMGFVVLSKSSLHAVVFYLIIYYLMNIGAFTVVQAVRDKTGGEMLSDFRGLGSRAPMLAIFMTIFLLSLTGLPPMAGFIAKFYLFASVIERGGFWYVALAIVGVLNSAVSLYYYLKVVRSMYLSSPTTDEPLNAHRGYGVITGVLALPVLVLGLYWSPVSGPIKEQLALYRAPADAAEVATVPGEAGD